jgi:hypothetical protein
VIAGIRPTVHFSPKTSGTESIRKAVILHTNALDIGMTAITTNSLLKTHRISRIGRIASPPTVSARNTQSDTARADIIGIRNWKAVIEMLHTITRAPYFTGTLVLGLGLFTALLFATELWTILSGTEGISHTSVAIAYAAISSLLPLWGITRDRRYQGEYQTAD